MHGTTYGRAETLLRLGVALDKFKMVCIYQTMLVGEAENAGAVVLSEAVL